MTETFADYDPKILPEPVLAYLDAHDEHRFADALAAFAPDATVLDDGSVYFGVAEIEDWLEKSSAEYTYTSTRIGQSIVDDARTTVQIRLDGDFPGSTVVLRYQFELRDGRIGRLAIEV